MPVYCYKCTCGYEIERYQSIDADYPMCAECGEPLRRDYMKEKPINTYTPSKSLEWDKKRRGGAERVRARHGG